ncbi:MAG TPA: S53 family peptidase [Acidisarcina sp.]
MDPKKSALTRKITASKKAAPAKSAKPGKKGSRASSDVPPTQLPEVELKGSHRNVAAGAKPVGGVDDNEVAQVTLRLKRKASPDFDKLLAELTLRPVSERKYLTQQQLAEAHGAAAESVAIVDAFAHAHSLTVLETSLAKRTVKLQGTLRDLQTAFGVKLKNFKSPVLSYRGRVGSIFIPKELAAVVDGVYGLDNRPAAKSHIHFGASGAPTLLKKTGKKTSKKKKKKKPKPTPKPQPPSGTARSFNAPEVAALYNFPTNLNGAGQTIALIELNTPNDPNQPTQNVGAGYVLSDLKAYFSDLGLTPPQVTAISVDGGANLPNLNPNADGEVELDIEVAGAIAPGANIAVYFAPNTDQGFIDAVSAAVHDTVRKPSIVSISWGGPEDFSTQQFLDGINAALQDAALLGVTVCVASGDSGSSDVDAASARTAAYKGAHVDFPASSRYALGCGGTRLIGTGAEISSEVVWNEGRAGGAGGGGVSSITPQPAWQPKGSVPVSPKGTAGRGSPDVCGDADPNTGYNIVLQGATLSIGGTSAVAPLWAGLLALINQQLATNGKPSLGFVNSLIYGLPASANAFHDITSGNNDIDGNLGVYSAVPGWDACTGLGSPNGSVLLAELTK